MDPSKILLVGDELKFVRTLRRNLESLGYKVWTARGDTETYKLAEQTAPDLFILNWNFAKDTVNGLEICTHLRRMSQALLFVLSTACDERLKIQALDIGADNYMVMPLSMKEFLARVRSALRRWSTFCKEANHQETDTSIHGDLQIRERSRQILLCGRRVRLTPTEFLVLLCLIQGKGKVVTYEELLQSIWGDEANAHRGNIRVFISQLRHKIEDDPLHPVHILTEPGLGYRFASENYPEIQSPIIRSSLPPGQPVYSPR